MSIISTEEQLKAMRRTLRNPKVGSESIDQSIYLEFEKVNVKSEHVIAFIRNIMTTVNKPIVAQLAQQIRLVKKLEETQRRVDALTEELTKAKAALSRK
jgi:hypothetical protein